jgi:hypothetical protein
MLAPPARRRPKRLDALGRRALPAALLAISLAGSAFAQASDPLPSWNDGAAKKSSTDFVARVTAQGSPDFVPPELRVATFDNDGTLWCEQPFYFQLAFVYHTDAEREYAYDRNSRIGRLDKALDEARKRGWTVVDMKADWKTIFPNP